ncbi:tetratricopeptide repeat protein [Planctomicrobium sp. SH668]|uniref:tetratricopeptide repeat protein n=1 Tax=Planctomicrobium sp. SH668 TaxID=3448126 RepID=UPI003F5B37C4
MRETCQQIVKVLAGCFLITTVSGCITISPGTPSFSLKSLAKPQVQKASYEEQMETAPGNPKNPAKLKIAYGKMLEESGQLSEARKSYSEAVEIAPKEIEALIGLARLDHLAGNSELAEINYKKAVKLSPHAAMPHYHLGQFYASQNRWEESCEQLTKAMLADPDETQSRYALAVALVHTGKVDAALPHFIRTIGDAEAHYNVGRILYEDGKAEQAERHFALAATKKPDLVAAQSWLAHIHEQRQLPSADTPTPIGTSEVLPAGHSTAPEHSTAIPDLSGYSFSAQQIEQTANQKPL